MPPVQVRLNTSPWVLMMMFLASLAMVRCQGTSGIILTRPAGSIAVPAWVPVKRQLCGTSTSALCVTPTTSSSDIVSGISVSAASNPGDNVFVLQEGATQCTFLNLPVQGDTVVAGNGGCTDVAQTILTTPSTSNVVGQVRQVISATPPYSAFISLAGPARFGELLTAASFDPSTVPAYVQANQTPQVNSDWNSVSGPSQILNKPTIPTNISQFYLNGTLQNNVRCNFMTATTNGSGIATFNYSAMGYTSILGQPQATVQGTGTNPYFVNLQGAATTTSATVYSSVGSIISVVGINVSLIGAAVSAPVGLLVCGV